MATLGTLHQWSRFLDAKSDEESVAALRRHITRISDVYDELSECKRRLWDSPTGEIEEVLAIAAVALLDAEDMLEQVATRFRAGERESA